MGSINCKEYKTTTKNPACAQGNGDTGSYKFRPEVDMDVYVESIVCNETDIEENSMKQLDFDGDDKILLIKQNGKLSAIGNKCSHYGALLQNGTLGEGHVRCPFHGACFNIETGDIEDFPGLDSIPCYKVNVEKDGKVRVRAKRTDLEKNKRIKDMVKRCETDERVFVIVGGGPSAGVCAETLRQEGYTGRIVMICQENTQPYDRIKLSKVMDTPIENLQFRKLDFYNEYSIETILGVEATKLNSQTKTIHCSNGNAIQFDKLYIATGCRAVKAPIPGAELRNVFTIRDHKDTVAISAMLKDDINVVCLGSSFIALEAAAFLVKKVKSVTLIARDSVPLNASFGSEIGQRVLELFQENNVKMIMNSGIKEVIGTDSMVSGVELVDGTKLPCDLCIMGTGTRYNTEFLQGSEVIINSNGSVDADIHLKTNVPDVYVGGDIANAPVFAMKNEKAAIGHYQLAQYHGRIAALNMAGKVQELHAIPFFWSMIFNKSFRYTGHGKAHETKIIGSLAELKFVAFYMDKEGNVIAVASCGRDPVVAQYAEYLSLGRQLHKKDLEAEDPFVWTKNLTRAGQRAC